MQLESKRVLVTGAASGMGREVALESARQGAEHVVLIDINKAALEETAEEIHQIGVSTSDQLLDLRDRHQIFSAIDDITHRLDGFDTLVNAAGVLDHQFTNPDRVGADSLNEDAWDAVMDINLKAVWLLSQAASPILKTSNRGPSITNFASVAGMHGAKMTAYPVSKAAVIQLTRVTAINLSPQVRVNAVSPGSFRTPMSQAHLDAAEDQHERALSMYGTHLIPRLGDPSEIAKTVCFLSSDAASFITGTNLPVDGGTTAWRGMQTNVPLD